MNKRLKEIQKRLAAIRNEADNEEADIDALNKEADDLINEQEKINKAIEQRKKLTRRVIENGITVQAFEDHEKEPLGVNSEEYRSAFLKRIAALTNGSNDLIPMFGDLTERELRAFTFTTQNTPAIIPTGTMNKIVELVKSSNAIFADLSHSRITDPYRIPRHKSIVEGDAAKADEEAVPEGEKDTFDYIDIIGKDFKKGAELSANIKMQSIDAFEDWLIYHVIKRLTHAANAYVYEVLDNENKGIVKENNITTEKGLTSKDLLKALGSVTGGNVKIYANRKTIYGHLAAVAESDTSNKALFFTPNEDPLIRANIYGAFVKEDLVIPNNTLYIGAPELIESNIFHDPDVIPMAKPGRLTWYDGFMKFDCGLLDPKGFAKVTITPSA